MPLHVKEIINGGIDKIVSTPIALKIAKNPFYTALLIAVVITIISLFVFNDVKCKKSESVKTLAIRLGVYSLLFITAIHFIQNYVLINDIDKQHEDENMQYIYDGVDTMKPTVNINGEIAN